MRLRVFRGQHTITTLRKLNLGRACPSLQHRMRSIVWDAWLRWRLCVCLLGRGHGPSQQVLEEDWEEEEEEAQDRETLFSSLAEGSRNLSRPRAGQHASLGAVSLKDSPSAKAGGARAGNRGMFLSTGDGSVRGDARDGQGRGKVGDNACPGAESTHDHQHTETQSVVSTHAPPTLLSLPSPPSLTRRRRGLSHVSKS